MTWLQLPTSFMHCSAVTAVHFCWAKTNNCAMFLGLVFHFELFHWLSCGKCLYMYVKSGKVKIKLWKVLQPVQSTFLWCYEMSLPWLVTAPNKVREQAGPSKPPQVPGFGWRWRKKKVVCGVCERETQQRQRRRRRRWDIDEVQFKDSEARRWKFEWAHLRRGEWEREGERSQEGAASSAKCYYPEHAHANEEGGEGPGGDTTGQSTGGQF